jgi:hypothetical protein
MLLAFINKLLRKTGVIAEEVHHIEDDFFAIAKRFEKTAAQKASAASGAAEQVAYFRDIEKAARSASARAENNARKVRDFFN